MQQLCSKRKKKLRVQIPPAPSFFLCHTSKEGRVRCSFQKDNQCCDVTQYQSHQDQRIYKTSKMSKNSIITHLIKFTRSNPHPWFIHAKSVVWNSQLSCGCKITGRFMRKSQRSMNMAILNLTHIEFRLAVKLLYEFKIGAGSVGWGTDLTQKFHPEKRKK
jgi:hypothetical protein